MFNHTKDVPFAAAMIAAFYFLLRVARDLPTARWSDVIGFGLMLGAATGLRAIGLLLIGYAGSDRAGVGVAQRMRHAVALAPSSFNPRCGSLPAFVLGYLIMIAAWPWASLDPFNPLRAIFSFAHFHYEIRTIVSRRCLQDGRSAVVVRAVLSCRSRRRSSFLRGRFCAVACRWCSSRGRCIDRRAGAWSARSKLH